MKHNLEPLCSQSDTLGLAQFSFARYIFVKVQREWEKGKGKRGLYSGEKSANKQTHTRTEREKLGK